MKEHFVSIVMPVYQVEKYIKDSVNSVIFQTYKNFELIIVDDGSKDKSIKIAQSELFEKNINYKIVRQDNAGLGMARNTGVRESNGEWILFVDSDDLLHPNALGCLNSAIDDDVDLVFSKYADIYHIEDIKYRMAKFVSRKIKAEQIQNDFLERKKVILVPGTLYRKSFLIDNNLFFEKIPWSEDQQFMWRVLSKVRNVSFVDEELYQYYRHENSIMTASKIDSIIVSYPFIKRVETLYPEGSKVRRFLVARWVMGTLNSATKLCEKKEWLRLYNSLEGKTSFRILKRIPGLKNKLFAYLGCFSAPLYYKLVRNVKR